MTTKPEPVLKDHVRKGKRLLSPFLNALGNKYSPYSWVYQIVPELLWLALLAKAHGQKRAVELSYNLVSVCNSVVSTDAAPLFAKFSSFSTLTQIQLRDAFAKIDGSARQEIIYALGPLNHLAPQHPLNFLFSDTDPEINRLPESAFLDELNELYNRESRSSTLALATATYLGMRQGKIVLAQHLVEKRIRDFEIIDDYPKTEESRIAASLFRASAPMFLMSPFEDLTTSKNDWIIYFWGQISGFGECARALDFQDDKVVTSHPLEAIVVNFRNYARRDLRFYITNWPVDFNSLERYEVVSALLARQTTLAVEMAAAPAIWNPHIAPMILRAMADVYITTAWILKDPDKRARMFIEDGLGAIKLENAHRKRQIDQLTDEVEIAEAMKIYDYWDAWLKMQRIPYFVEVNLGSWSGLNTRRMAEEADCIEFYNNVYQPFSSAVHSNWAHISDKNAMFCDNPAHRGHRISTIVEIELDPSWVYLSGKYLQKTFSLFGATFGIKYGTETAFQYISRMLFEPEVAGAADEDGPPGAEL